MKSTREEFQDYLSYFEYDLMTYKNSHPRNFGAMIRYSFPNFMIWLAVIFVIDSIWGSGKGNDLNGMDAICEFLVAFVLLAFGILFKIRYPKPLHMGKGPEDALDSAEGLSEDFPEYPDTKLLADKCMADLKAAIRNKRNIKLAYYGILCGSFLLYSARIAYKSYMNVTLEEKAARHEIVINQNYNDGVLQLFGLEYDEPFLSLKPLEKDFYGKVKTVPETLDLYLGDKDEIRYFWAKKPEIEGCSTLSKICITITDTAGNPVPRCPRLEFMTDGENVIISQPFCRAADVFQDCPQRKFQMMQVLRNLRANREKIRFAAEKPY